MQSILAAILLVAGIAGAIVGVNVYAEARSAVHEIEALIAFVIAALGIGLGATVSGVEAVRRELTALRVGRAPTAAPPHRPPYTP